jgi:hypothetical protein
MTPEQHAEFDEFTAIKMTVFRQMFPVAAAIARGESGAIRTNDAAMVVPDPAAHFARFQDAVMQAWARHKANKDTSCKVFADNIAKAYADGQL